MSVGDIYNINMVKNTFVLPSDHERVALGNEEGLFVIHVTKDGKTSPGDEMCWRRCHSLRLYLHHLLRPSSEIIRVGDNKKVHHIDLILQEQLLAVISGRNRHVRLFPTQALDGRETESYKLAETKGCQTIVSGLVRNGSLTCLCVAMKRQIICYEVEYRCAETIKARLPNHRPECDVILFHPGE